MRQTTLKTELNYSNCKKTFIQIQGDLATSEKLIPTHLLFTRLYSSDQLSYNSAI